jgi:hypothetical protein
MKQRKAFKDEYFVAKEKLRFLIKFKCYFRQQNREYFETLLRKYFQLHVIDFVLGESSLKYVFGIQAKSTSLLLSVQSFCYL